MLITRILSVVILSVLLASPAYAQHDVAAPSTAPAPATGPIPATGPNPTTAPAPATRPALEPQRMTLGPSSQPFPALRYRLHPDFTAEPSENAASLYLIAVSNGLLGSAPIVTDKGASDRIDGWFKSPVESLPRDEVRAFLGKHSSMTHLVKLAARRSSCDWGIPLREDGFDTLLPHLGGVRTLAELLALDARLALSERRFNDAAESIQAGLAMARHVDEGGLLIQSLVAAAIDAMMLREVETWAQVPGSPNQYWPLSELPQPLISFHHAMEQERVGVMATLPGMKEAAAGTMTADQLQVVLRKLQAVTTGAGKDRTAGEALCARRRLRCGSRSPRRTSSTITSVRRLILMPWRGRKSWGSISRRRMKR